MTRSPEHNSVVRFYAGNKRSLRGAINAMCGTCVGTTASAHGEGFKDRIEPGYRTEIRCCTVLSCPLHGLRPFQQKESAARVPVTERKEQAAK